MKSLTFFLLFSISCITIIVLILSILYTKVDTIHPQNNELEKKARQKHVQKPKRRYRKPIINTKKYENIDYPLQPQQLKQPAIVKRKVMNTTNTVNQHPSTTTPLGYRDLHMLQSSIPSYEKNVALVVNSSSRNIETYNHSNYYSIILDKPLQNITQISINQGVFNATEIGIYPSSCWIDIKLYPSDKVYSVKIPIGSYEKSVKLLVDQIQHEFSKQNVPLTINYDYMHQKVVIVPSNISTESIQLLFGNGPHAKHCIYKQLGFKPQDTECLNKLVSINQPDLSGTQSATIKCDELRNTSNHVVGTLLFTGTPVRTTYIGTSSTMWPISKLSKLTLNINVGDRLYYTAGMDVTMRVHKNQLQDEVELDENTLYS